MNSLGPAFKSRAGPRCLVAKLYNEIWARARGAGHVQGKVIGARTAVLAALRWSDHMRVALVGVGGGIVAKWRHESVTQSGQKS
jgi:hypothetical protein